MLSDQPQVAGGCTMVGRWSGRQVGLFLGHHISKDLIYDALDDELQNKSPLTTFPQNPSGTPQRPSLRHVDRGSH